MTEAKTKEETQQEQAPAADTTKAVIYKAPRSTGNGMAFFIPKSLFDCQVLQIGKTYKLIVQEVSFPTMLIERAIGFFHSLFRQRFLRHSD